MRNFQLVRIVDVTGVSGTGVVAQGVEFDDKTCVIRWLSATPSTNMYASVIELMRVHGHNGNTKINWLDNNNDKMNFEEALRAARNKNIVVNRKMNVTIQFGLFEYVGYRFVVRGSTNISVSELLNSEGWEIDSRSFEKRHPDTNDLAEMLSGVVVQL